jgi:hypothetical protein
MITMNFPTLNETHKFALFIDSFSFCHLEWWLVPKNYFFQTNILLSKLISHKCKKVFSKKNYKISN